MRKSLECHVSQYFQFQVYKLKLFLQSQRSGMENLYLQKFLIGFLRVAQNIVQMKSYHISTLFAPQKHTYTLIVVLVDIEHTGCPAKLFPL